MPNSFVLNVTLGYGCEKHSQVELNKINTKPPGGIISGFFTGNHHKCFVASASDVQLSIDPQNQGSTFLVAIFVPPAMIDEASFETLSSQQVHTAGSCVWIPEVQTMKLTQKLLPQIHPCLLSNTSKIKGLIRTSIAANNAPAEIVLLEIAGITMSDLLTLTNGSSLAEYTTMILKILPISKISFTSTTTTTTTTNSQPPSISSSSLVSLLIPTCPVCIHRIDHARLGLPNPTNVQLCSKFCPSPDFHWNASEAYTQAACAKQRFLEKWPSTRCKACQVIQEYWSSSGQLLHNQELQELNEHTDLFCGSCAMHKTLWVCLTCGFVGCGRYSNKHSFQHFTQTNHPFALELATFRIWDYLHGEYGGYAHRVDLLECPSSPILSHPWVMARSARSISELASAPSISSAYHNMSKSPSTRFAADTEKAPKKATIIGEEYEALLQSALEDQAHYYEGEITRLKAELTAEFVDQKRLSNDEQQEFDVLRQEIDDLRMHIEETSRKYLDAQAQDASHRAASQRLLREQQEAKELLKEIEIEAQKEAQLGKTQVEDLEQQVSDLTANLRMRQQFSQNEELNNAQIFGTSGETSSNNNNTAKKGKNKSRFFRR